MKTPKSPSHRELIAYLEGELPQSSSEQLAADLKSSPTAQKDLEEYRALMADLALPNSQYEKVNIYPQVRRSLAHTPAQERPWLFHWQVFLSASVALIVGMLMGGLLPIFKAPHKKSVLVDEDTIRAKSAGAEMDETNRWINIETFHVGQDGQPRPLKRQFSHSDGLLFAYSNVGPRPYSFLMIFAVDQTGNLFWYYPAYEEKGANPQSIPIVKGRTRVQLRQLVRQKLSEGPLIIFSVFSRQPYPVRKVEALFHFLAEQGWWRIEEPPKLPIPWAVQRTQRVEVK